MTDKDDRTPDTGDVVVVHVNPNPDTPGYKTYPAETDGNESPVVIDPSLTNHIRLFGDESTHIALGITLDPAELRSKLSVSLPHIGERLYAQGSLDRIAHEFDKPRNSVGRTHGEAEFDTRHGLAAILVTPPAFSNHLDKPLPISLEPTPEIDIAGTYPREYDPGTDSAWGRFAKNWINHLQTIDPIPAPYKTLLVITMVQRRSSDKGCTLKIEGFTKCWPKTMESWQYDTHTVLLETRRVSSRRLVAKLLSRHTGEFVRGQVKQGIDDVMHVWLYEPTI